MSTTKEKIISILRWTAMTPVAILVNMIVYFLITALSKISIGGVIGWIIENPDSLLIQLSILITANGIAGFCFVYTASYVAPKHKKQVAIIFASIMILLSGILIVLSLDENLQDILRDIFELVIMTAGAIVAGYSIYKEKVKIGN